MKYTLTILIVILVALITSCSKGKSYEKGFQVGSNSENNEINQVDGLTRDSLLFETRPSNVLLTS